MVIGIDASRANEANRTGTEWYAFHLIQQCKRLARPDERFILYSKEPLRGELAKLPDNFSSRVLGWPPGFLWTQLRLAWEMLVRPPDVLFVPAHTIPIISPRRTVTTVHDVGFERWQHLYGQTHIGPSHPVIRWLLNLIVRLLTVGRYGTSELDYHRWSVRLALRKASHLITVSKFSRDEINSIFPNHRPVTVIYNGFNPEYGREPTLDDVIRCRRQYGLDHPYLLWLGRLEEKKNTPRLVAAFYELKKHYRQPLDLVLIGKPGYGYERIQQQYERVPQEIRRAIHELGWVNAGDVSVLLHEAQAFIFPTLYEGFGIPILEAMAAGVPVLTSNQGAAAEIAGHAALLVDPTDVSAMSRGMKRLVEEEALRQQFSDAGRKQVSDFSWERCAQATLAVLRAA